MLKLSKVSTSAFPLDPVASEEQFTITYYMLISLHGCEMNETEAMSAKGAWHVLGVQMNVLNDWFILD